MTLVWFRNVVFLAFQGSGNMPVTSTIMMILGRRTTDLSRPERSRFVTPSGPAAEFALTRLRRSHTSLGVMSEIWSMSVEPLASNSTSHLPCTPHSPVRFEKLRRGWLGSVLLNLVIQRVF